MGRPRTSRAEALVSRLPASLAYRIDLRRPGLEAGFGGPFNGQEVRQAAVRSMFERLAFDLVVETGTYRGTTTAFLRSLTAAPIVTVESVPRYASYSRARLAKLPAITVRGGDSATQIRRLAFSPRTAAARNPFFYLDAHGGLRGRPLPLRWEILEVQSGWPSFCIVIDDFKVPDDLGYRFAGYGRGFGIDPEHLVGLDLSNVTWFWPAAAGTTETGRRRGWVVLARGEEMVASLRANPNLREDVPA